MTVYPCGSQQPLASNLNYVGGQTVPNAVIARVGSGGAVCLFVSEGTHLVADVTGYFPPGSGFDSLVPARLLETRWVPAWRRQTDCSTRQAGGPRHHAALAGDGTRRRSRRRHRSGVERDCHPASRIRLRHRLSVRRSSPIGVELELRRWTDGTEPGDHKSAPAARCACTPASPRLVVDVGGSFAPESAYFPLLPARLLDTESAPVWAPSTAPSTVAVWFPGAARCNSR